MYGAALDRGPRGQVGAGLGQTTSTGTFGIIPPTLDVTTTGQEETVDGVRMIFQMAPGSEAPAEMHVYFPQRRALCMAENATHVLHNILTIRGAQVRDAHAWAGYLTEAIDLFGERPGAGLRLPPLADLGPRAGGGVPGAAAGPLRLPARPDPAPAQPGPDRRGDRRGDGAAAGAGGRLARARLLRLGQPQRQGDLPALHGLVRRQPRPPVAAPAGGGRPPLRRVHGRRGRRRRQGAGVLRRRGLPLGGRGAQPRRVRRAGPRRGPRAAGRHLRAARLRRGERHLALRLPLRRRRAAVTAASGHP